MLKRNRWVLSLAALTAAGTIGGSVLPSLAAGGPRPGEYCAAADEGATADYVTASGTIDHMVCEPSGNRHRWVTVSTSDPTTPAPPVTTPPPPVATTPAPVVKPTVKPKPTPKPTKAKVVVRGPAGPRGPRGYTGAVGPQGATGAMGAQGATGPQGIQGIPGPTGQGVGVPGPVGPTGATGATGPAGPVGATGPQGPAGGDGAAGTNGISGYQVVSTSTNPNDFLDSATVNCPAGKVALGGGGTSDTASLHGSVPVISEGVATGWTINTGGAAGGTMFVYAICANVS